MRALSALLPNFCRPFRPGEPPCKPAHALPTAQLPRRMLEYKVTFLQFVEWICRCADRGDMTERFPLHVKLSQYLRKIVSRLSSPLVDFRLPSGNGFARLRLVL